MRRVPLRGGESRLTGRFQALCELISYFTPLPVKPYKVAAGKGAGSETSTNFGNNEYIESYGKMCDKYTQTDTIAVLLASSVGLARTHPNMLVFGYHSPSAAVFLLESFLHTCTSTIKSTMVLAIGVTMPHVARLRFGKQMVWQCKTYDRNCVSVLPNHQTFLTMIASCPGKHMKLECSHGGRSRDNCPLDN